MAASEDTTTREDRLASLEAAVTEWADRRITELEDQAAFLRSVFAGRTSGGRLTDYALESTSALLEDEISAFLAE